MVLNFSSGSVIIVDPGGSAGHSARLGSHGIMSLRGLQVAAQTMSVLVAFGGNMSPGWGGHTEPDMALCSSLVLSFTMVPADKQAFPRIRVTGICQMPRWIGTGIHWYSWLYSNQTFLLGEKSLCPSVTAFHVCLYLPLSAFSGLIHFEFYNANNKHSPSASACEQKATLLGQNQQSCPLISKLLNSSGTSIWDLIFSPLTRPPPTICCCCFLGFVLEFMK